MVVVVSAPMGAEVSVPMPAEASAPMPAEVSVPMLAEASAPTLASDLASADLASAASRVSIRALLVRRGRSADLPLYMVVRLRLFLTEGLVTSFGPAPGFNTSVALQALALDRRPGKAWFQGALTLPHVTLVTRLR